MGLMRRPSNISAVGDIGLVRRSAWCCRSAGRLVAIPSGLGVA